LSRSILLIKPAFDISVSSKSVSEYPTQRYFGVLFPAGVKKVITFFESLKFFPSFNTLFIPYTMLAS